jgi:glycosyltransferase involved in cell wall biosynthesis
MAFQVTNRRTALEQPLSIHTPLLYLPFPNNEFARRVNARLLDRTLTRWMKRLDIQAPVVWSGTPSLSVIEVTAKLRPRLLVYDCLDNFPIFHGNSYHIIQAEQQLASQAQVVFATAAELYNRMKLINPRTYLMPNASDFEHFAHSAIRELEPPKEMTPARKPILGYIGEMAEWFDFDLVYNLALEHPDWSIVLIGVVHVDPKPKLFKLPNVYFLGRKAYADLPAYLNQFDVCLLPFKISALTSAINPVKLYEYLAAGKPVVSTPLTEVFQYQDVLNIADRFVFSEAVKVALESDSELKVQQRTAVARQNTWDQRVDQIVNILGAVP